MYIRNDISSLIFFAFWHRKCPPAGRQGRPKRPIVDCAPIIFLPLLLTGKVADNQIMKLTKFEKGIIVLVFAGVFFAPTTADAKMFGKKCYTVTSGGGDSCVTTRTICKQRFFWINVGTSVQIDSIEC